MVKVRDVALKILNQCDERQVYVNLALKNSNAFNLLENKDKALCYHMIYGVLQNRLFLDYSLNLFLKKAMAKQRITIQNILRLGAYQLMFLDRIPAHAACNEAVKQVKQQGFTYASGFVNGVLRNLNRSQPIALPDPKQDELEYWAVKYSHPKWLLRRWARDYGKEVVEKTIVANNQTTGLSVRINPLKTTQSFIAQSFAEHKLSFRRGEMFPEQVLLVNSPSSLAQTAWFKDGLITLQNEGSLWLVQGLAVQPGMSVLDMCSAPGGKTALIGTYMKNRGHILAIDINRKRLKLVRDTCNRLGITNVKTQQADASSLTVAQVGKFDRILCDVPCTGLGTLRTKPEIRWYRTEEDILAINSTQQQLLATACQLLKPGGKLVYSTCSNEKEETDMVVEKVLADNSDLICLERKHLWPYMFASEGFYRAVVTKQK